MNYEIDVIDLLFILPNSPVYCNDAGSTRST